MVKSLSLVSLSVSILILIHCKNEKTLQETQFSIARPDIISFIEFSSKDFLQQKIYLHDGRWWLNDTTPVRSDAIENIFKILPSLKIKFYPPKSAWEYMIKTIQSEGVKVSFFDNGHRVIKSMVIGGTTNDERGTYAMLEGSSQPYVIHVPGFEGSLASRFKLSNQDWRDRMILNVDPGDIEFLKIQYPQDPNKGFAIQCTPPATFRLFDLNQYLVPSSAPRIQTYLESFMRVGCEGIENDFPNKGLVLASQPHAILTLKLRSRPMMRTIKFYTMESVGEESLERMFVYDERDFFLAQVRILQKLFRSIDYFKLK